MKPICSVCNNQLSKTEEAGVWNCDNCKAIYREHFEIMKYDDEFVSSHSDEMPELAGVSTAGSGLEAADDEIDPSLLDQLHRNMKTKPNQGEGANIWET